MHPFRIYCVARAESPHIARIRIMAFGIDCRSSTLQIAFIPMVANQELIHIVQKIRRQERIFRIGLNKGFTVSGDVFGELRLVMNGIFLVVVVLGFKERGQHERTEGAFQWTCVPENPVPV